MLNNLSYEELLQLEKAIKEEKKKFINIQGAIITDFSYETITLETKNTSYTYSGVFDEIISTPIKDRKPGVTLSNILSELGISLNSSNIRLEELKILCRQVLGCLLANENYHVQEKR